MRVAEITTGPRDMVIQGQNTSKFSLADSTDFGGRTGYDILSIVRALSH